MKPEQITLIQKTALTVIMLTWYVLYAAVLQQPNQAPAVIPAAYVPASSLALHHLLAIITHANIWHLLGNLFVLWLMRSPLHLLPAFIIAYVCSFYPTWGLLWPIGETVGFSGVLFAIVGIKWGRYCRQAAFRHLAYADFCMKILPFAVVGILIPNVNWCLHLYCLLAAFAYARFRQ